MRKVICLFIRLSIIAVALCGLAICVWWYPYQLDMVNLDSYMTEKIINAQLIFYWCTSLPCFIVLGLGWVLSDCIEKGEEFSEKSKKILKACAWLLFIDVATFLIGNITFLILRWNLFVIAYLLLSLGGLVIAFAFAVLAHYVGKAVELRKENEEYV